MQDKINKILSMSSLMCKCEDDNILFESINSLRIQKEFLQNLRKELVNEYIKGSGSGSAKLIQLVVSALLYGEKKITPELIEQLKKEYINDKNFCKKYLSDDEYLQISSSNKFSKKSSEPFANWKKYSNILRRLLFIKRDFNNVNKWLKDISNDILNKFHNELSNYTYNTQGFLGNQGYGRSNPVIMIFNKNFNTHSSAIQLSLYFDDGEVYTKIEYGEKIKEDNSKTIIDVIQSDKYSQIISAINQDIPIFIEQTNKALNNSQKYDQDTNYWWINANPKIFEFSKMVENQEEFYTIVNEKGNKRRLQENFLNAKVGDKFIGYDAYPVAQIVAKGVITKCNKHALYFKKTQNLKQPLSDMELKKYKELSNMERNGQQGSLFKLTKQEYDFIINLIDKKSLDGENNMKQPLNQILYGPPGTGKTYNTIVKTMEIIGIPESNKEAHNALQTILIEQKSDTPKNTDNEYKIVKKEFDKLKDLKQIEFITFHQSYSYEEFVEGIKPEIDWQKNYDEIEQNKSESNNIRYVGKMGIFREICERASNPIMVNISQFNECYQNLVNDINNAKDKFTIPYTKNKVLTLRINTKQNIDIWTGTDTSKQKAGVIKQINIITQKADNTRIRYLPYITNYLRDKYGLEIKEHQNNENYVLIIDEINRGNISKIFGELITLIEEDKRAGEDNAITVTLPYSGEPFSVPNNLYIIGTMNTADKSLALLDVALRRRFEFVPMYPKYKEEVHYENENYSDILKELNNQILIKKNNNADYLIGHSYFLGNEPIEDIFNKKVIPLLMEYFNGKIDEVYDLLNDHFTITFDTAYQSPNEVKTKCKFYYLQIKEGTEITIKKQNDK